MKKLILSLLLGCVAIAHAEVYNNQWVRKALGTTYSRGWIDWPRNTVDGRYCLFSGAPRWGGMPNDIWCYSANTDQWEAVYPGDLGATLPRGGDEQAMVWDNIAEQYIMLDPAHNRPEAYGFSMATRSWKPLTNADYAGIENRRPPFGSGSASSLDHNIGVITHGNSGIAVTRIIDYVNKTYSEITTGTMPSYRYLIQNMFVYAGSLKKFVLFGGRRIDVPMYLNDLWLFDPVTKTWSQQAQSGDIPDPRANAMMAYDSIQNVIYLYGGEPEEPSSNVYILDLSNWKWTKMPAPTGTPWVDYPAARHQGYSFFDPAAGFCQHGGASSSAQWEAALYVWCYRHTVVAQDLTPPADPPSGGRSFILKNIGDLTVNWLPSSSPDVERYELQRSIDNGLTWIDQQVVIANGSASYSYTYTGVPDSIVRVRAVDTSNNPSEYLLLN